jgi:lipid-A-disaccharide synthase
MVGNHKRALFLAGEASGDYHAARLVKDLRSRDPSIEVYGIGGDRMASAGMRLLRHYRDINTIGPAEGLEKLRNIISAYREMKRELRAGTPDVFIPVDFPDVNIRLCAWAKRAGVPVCYFISPQVWAWRRGRIAKIARRVDRMMTIFPFEPELYRAYGLQAEFVGHSMVEDIPADTDKAALRASLELPKSAPVIALLPGSRPAEVARILPILCAAARLCAARIPDARFVLPLAGHHLRGLAESIVAEGGISVRLYDCDAAEVMGAADCGAVTSGTATLQAVLARMPHVLVYRVDSFTWQLGIKILKPLVMDKDIHLGMANMLSIHSKEPNNPLEIMAQGGAHISCEECGRPLVVPELLQEKCNPHNVAHWIQRFISDASLRKCTLDAYTRLRRMLELPEDGRSAADVVWETLFP